MVLRLVLLLRGLCLWVNPKVLIKVMGIMVVEVVKVSVIGREAMLSHVSVARVVAWPVELVQIVMRCRSMMAVVGDVLRLVGVGKGVVRLVVIQVPPDGVVVVSLVFEILWVLNEVIIHEFLVVWGPAEMFDHLML